MHVSFGFEQTNLQTWTSSQTFFLSLLYITQNVTTSLGFLSSIDWLSFNSLKILEPRDRLSIWIDLHYVILLFLDNLSLGLISLGGFLLALHLETVLMLMTFDHSISHCFYLLKPGCICLFSFSQFECPLSLWLHSLSLLGSILFPKFLTPNILSVNITSYPILFSILYSPCHPHNELLIYLLPRVLLSFSYAFYILFILVHLLQCSACTPGTAISKSILDTTLESIASLIFYQFPSILP